MCRVMFCLCFVLFVCFFCQIWKNILPTSKSGAKNDIFEPQSFEAGQWALWVCILSTSLEPYLPLLCLFNLRLENHHTARFRIQFLKGVTQPPAYCIQKANGKQRENPERKKEMFQYLHLLLSSPRPRGRPSTALKKQWYHTNALYLCYYIPEGTRKMLT